MVCHFYNEEFLLPWWMQHHKRVFDHGIMIDYNSTDRSREIIHEICPNWEIRLTRNQYFDSKPIDEEVMDIEKTLDGWRMCLNVTEFLYGNTDHLTDLADPKRYYIGNYVFIDMEDHKQGQIILDHNCPLHQQRYWGYDEFRNRPEGRAGNIMGRMHRSIHNHPIKYPGGRHFSIFDKAFDDLAIFYYGWVDLGPAGIQRKTQIGLRISEGSQNHCRTAEEFITVGRELQAFSRDLIPEIADILEHNRRITGAEW